MLDLVRVFRLMLLAWGSYPQDPTLWSKTISRLIYQILGGVIHRVPALWSKIISRLSKLAYPILDFGQYWLSTVYFLGDFNETFKLLFFHAHLRMCHVSLKNIQK
jgi:hypothetical protein